MLKNFIKFSLKYYYTKHIWATRNKKVVFGSLDAHEAVVFFLAVKSLPLTYRNRQNVFSFFDLFHSDS